MGKFDGILICSDWDGTLATGRTIPERSAEAIRYFQSEGGIFTVCSGRNPDFLKQYTHIIHPNTYAICYNGALICDLDSGKELKRCYIEEGAYEILDRMLLCEPRVTSVSVHFSDTSVTRYSAHEYRAIKHSLIDSDVFKLTVSIEDEADGERMIEQIANTDTGAHCVIRSWKTLVEIVRRDGMKGSAAQLLKETVGSHLLVGIGDYENDVELITRADVGYAVGNAIDALKAIADRVTKRVDECAVAHVIDELEREFARK